MGGEALESALRALRHRDRSAHDVETRLTDQGFSEDERTEALEALTRTGVVDDVRFAEARAGSLAARGSGDDRIRFELARAGVDDAVVEAVLEALEPEVVRARAIVARRGGGARAARYLQAHGFAHDVIAAVAAPVEDELG
jgi:regulatory protein